MIDDRENFLGKSLNQFQRFARQSGPAAAASYTLLGSVLLLGSIGFLLDQFFHSSPLYINWIGIRPPDRVLPISKISI